MIDYAAHKVYMRSPEWKALRDRLIREVGGRCERCGAKQGLHVHHLTYERAGKERLADLELLCWICHAFAHGKPPRPPSPTKLSREERKRRVDGAMRLREMRLERHQSCLVWLDKAGFWITREADEDGDEGRPMVWVWMRDVSRDRDWWVSIASNEWDAVDRAMDSPEYWDWMRSLVDGTANAAIVAVMRKRGGG